MTCFSKKYTEKGSLVLGIGVNHDRTKGTATTTKKNYAKSLFERYPILTETLWIHMTWKKSISLDQLKRMVLNMENSFFQALTGSVIYLGQ